MTVETITGYFTSYGGIAIFIIVLLEYMNLPGFPAGDPISAVAVGIVSGLAATGADQISKQLKK